MSHYTNSGALCSKMLEAFGTLAEYEIYDRGMEIDRPLFTA